MREKNTFVKFLKGFTYAFNGIIYGIKTQRNMRVHISFIIFMFFFLLKYDFFKITAVEYAILVLTCVAVLALEFVNTAIESVVDLVSSKYNKLAKIAKDTAAAAVLVFAVGAVIIGLIIMLQPEAFKAMGEYYSSHILELVIVLVAIIIDIVWVLYPRKEKDK